REKERKRGASSCRSVLRFDVGNHAPHSLSATEIFGFIVCEGLKRGKKRERERERKRERERERERQYCLAKRRGEGSAVNLIFKCKQIYIAAKAPPTDVVRLSTAATLVRVLKLLFVSHGSGSLRCRSFYIPRDKCTDYVRATT
ncbi:hypothetical protein ALC53_11375, partial [Atta colombica]